MEKIFKISLSVSALLFSISLAFYLVYFLPKFEKIKLEAKQQDKQEVKDCLSVSMYKTEEIDGDREDANYFFKKCLREKGLTTN
jgi:hypothetical protein